jgi:hypothetical protein
LYCATIRVACAHVVASGPDPEEPPLPELPLDEPPLDEELLEEDVLPPEVLPDEPPLPDEAPPLEDPLPEEELPPPEDVEAPLDPVAPLLDPVVEAAASGPLFVLSTALGEPQWIAPKSARWIARRVRAQLRIERGGCIAVRQEHPELARSSKKNRAAHAF